MRLFNGRRRVAAASDAITRALFACVVLLVAIGGSTAAIASTGPMVKEVVEFTRLVFSPGSEQDALQSQVAPDGEKAFILTRRAEVSANRTVYELLLLDLRPVVLAAATRSAPQRLMRIEANRDNNILDPYLQELRWHDDHTILFLGRMNDAPHQAYALDIRTKKWTQLTFSERGVVSFDVSRDLHRVVYAAPVPNPPMAPGATGIVVGNNSFWNVNYGQSLPVAQMRKYQYFVAATLSATSGTSARSIGAPFPENGWFPPVSISPDGRWALLHRWDLQRQQTWVKDYPLVEDAVRRIVGGGGIDPLRYFSASAFWTPRRLALYRVADGTEQTVFDAPDDALAGYNQVRRDRLWQGTGESVVIAGTHLPLTTDGDPAKSRGSHIVEYWPDTGSWKIIAPLDGRLETTYALEGSSTGFVAIDGEKRRSFDRDATGTWHELTGESRRSDTDARTKAPSRHWTLRLRQALDVPPDIWAVDDGGRAVQLTALNAQFDKGSWGTMQPYAWKDLKGREWLGGLMTPSGYDPKVRYPVVIQTYGFSPDKFYLDGSNRSTGFTSGFAGRAFLREGIVVLAMPVTPSSGRREPGRGSIRDFYDGVHGAVASLAGKGIADRERIGIMGWSTTGEQVLNLLAFSDAPIRAATIMDGDSNTMYSMTVLYGRSEAILAWKERVNEGGPFGKSLERWVRNDPAMHTDCVKAALRIERYGPVVGNNWDIYALLRRQYKPAEMIVIPDGSHGLAKPDARMVSLQGNVDWFRFWLKGEQRSEVVIPGESAASLTDQYVRWHQMVDLKRADEAKPRCPVQQAE